MPQRRTAVKDLRKNHHRRMRNLDIRSDLRKTIKHFLSLIQNKNKTEAQTALKSLFKKLDKAAKENVLHKNTAARRKSRFSRALTGLK